MNLKPVPDQSATLSNETPRPKRRRIFRIGLYALFAIVLYIGWGSWRNHVLEEKKTTVQMASINKNPWGITRGMALNEAISLLPPTANFQPPIQEYEYYYVVDYSDVNGTRKRHNLLVGHHRFSLILDLSKIENNVTVEGMRAQYLGIEDPFYVKWLRSISPF